MILADKKSCRIPQGCTKNRDDQAQPVSWYSTIWPERVAIVTRSIMPAELNAWRTALPRRWDSLRPWYLDTVVDNGLATISAKNLTSSRDKVLVDGFILESQDNWNLLSLSCDSLGVGGWVLFLPFLSLISLFLSEGEILLNSIAGEPFHFNTLRKRPLNLFIFLKMAS